LDGDWGKKVHGLNVNNIIIEVHALNPNAAFAENQESKDKRWMISSPQNDTYENIETYACLSDHISV